MPGITINNNEYAGGVLERALIRAISGNDFVAGGHVHTRTGIKSDLTMPKFAVNGALVPAKDTWDETTDGGTLTVNHRKLSPKEVAVYLPFKPRDFEAHWFEDLLTGAMVFRELGPVLQMQIINALMENVDGDIGDMFMNGVFVAAPQVTYLDCMDGMVETLANDADVVDVPLPVALTPANIETKLREAYTLLPTVVKTRLRQDLKIFMSVTDADKYRDQQEDLSGKGPTSAVGEMGGGLRYRGIPIIELAYLPENNFFITYANTAMRSNIWLGIDESADGMAINIDKVRNHGTLWAMEMRMRAGLQIAHGEHVVSYAV